MARVCEICKKRTESGAQLARRGLPKKKGGIGLRVTGHTKRKFKPNVQRVSALVDGVSTRIKVCTRCIKAGKVIKPANMKSPAA